jgi:hypothetical protein
VQRSKQMRWRVCLETSCQYGFRRICLLFP